MRMHGHAEPFENFSPPSVVAGKPFVLLAVELDRELRGVALKVDDEVIERSLPPKLCAAKPDPRK
jgi:hypothetical protein